MTDKSELLPCPFCGSRDVELRESITDAQVCCNNCGARTGLVYLGADDASNAHQCKLAATAWNTRKALAAQPRDDVREAFIDGYQAAHLDPTAYDSRAAAIEAWEEHTALSRGDEQPDEALAPTTQGTDGLAALICERVTDDLIEGIGFGTIQAQGQAMDLLSELRKLAEGAGK